MRQYVPIKISEKKFKCEIEDFLKSAVEYKQRGVILTKNEFPSAEFAFFNVKANPVSLAFGVRFDFLNYNIEPPLITFIEPFSGKELVNKEIQVRIFDITVDQKNPKGVIAKDLIQAASPLHKPFLCVQGSRGYHNHPAHSGDSWSLYRNTGLGTLGYFLNLIIEKGTALVKGYLVEFKPHQQYDISPNL